MSNITAIINTASKTGREIEGWNVLEWEATFSSLEDLHLNRLMALSGVVTEYCAFVDDDDQLPDDSADQVQRLIQQMQAENAAIGYTDSRVASGDRSWREVPGPYRAVKHYTSVNFLHHLVVMRTEDALRLAATLPLGLYWTEYLLYAPLCRSGVTYLPEVGYIWNKGKTGMHTHADITKAQKNSLNWYLKNYPMSL